MSITISLATLRTMVADYGNVTMGEMQAMAAATLPNVTRTGMWNVLAARLRNGGTIDGAINVALVAGALRTTPADALGLIDGVKRVWLPILVRKAA